MRLVQYATAPYIICDWCIYYMRLPHILYATGAFIICDCPIYYIHIPGAYIPGVYTNVYAAFVYATTQPLHLLYVHAAFTYGASHMHHLHAFIYVFIYDVRAICMNFDTNAQMAPHSNSCGHVHFQRNKK